MFRMRTTRLRYGNIMEKHDPDGARGGDGTDTEEEASAAKTTVDNQLWQHNDSKKAEKYDRTENAAVTPENISGTGTPTKLKNMTTAEQSPDDVTSSLPWFEDMERDQSLLKNASQNPGGENADLGKDQLSIENALSWFTEKWNADLEEYQL